MVQEFHVVRCFTCEKFQVQQVRGSLSALLRVCQVRGSLSALLRVCQVRGSLSALLRVCQVRGSLSALLRVCQVKKATRWSCKVCGEKQSLLKVTVTQTQVSRWSKYMETPEEAELEEEQQLHGNNMTDRKRRDSPEQFCRNPEKPSARTSSPPESSRARSRSPNENKGSCGHFSRWTCFLGCDSQVQESRDPVVNGGCQQVGGDTSLSCGDIITSSRPLLPVSSLFETEDDFSFDEF
ncbi:MRN complex-interacting protein isoform X5 [Hippoglossus stenolepis]|uniref:MRN complex-interacting protein isoform X5 n=1 Tax=Hippoglossus stenolepis TaxID=195615 RepID=UPI001FAFA603|nr:MRN complex-interacting protein isoform X5 [Hippoglossus stenolepis]